MTKTTAQSKPPTNQPSRTQACATNIRRGGRGVGLEEAAEGVPLSAAWPKGGGEGGRGKGGGERGEGEARGSVCENLDGWLVAWDLCYMEKATRPGIASNENTVHVTTARSSADITTDTPPVQT